MRRGYKCTRFEVGDRIRTDIDRTPADFAETMGYGTPRYRDRDDFFRIHSADWILELRAALKDLLEKDRTVLSIGSGECEHEIPFFLEGYRIQGSDVVPEAYEATKALFPEFPVGFFDIFNLDTDATWDDALITGLDFYYDDAHTRVIFRNARSLLKPGGRLLFTLRYRSSPLTCLIDWVGVASICMLSNLVERFRRRGFRYHLKFHGYRRSVREIVALAGRGKSLHSLLVARRGRG